MKGFELRRDLIKPKFVKGSLAAVLRIYSQGGKRRNRETSLVAVSVTQAQILVAVTGC